MNEPDPFSIAAVRIFLLNGGRPHMNHKRQSLGILRFSQKLKRSRAIAAAIAVHLLLERTSAGYDMRALGANQTALRFMGMDVPRIVLVTMLLSGALAGLAGGVELLGVQQAAAATGAPADRAHRHADHRHRHRLRLHLAVLFLQELQGPLQRAAEPAPLLLKL